MARKTDFAKLMEKAQALIAANGVDPDTVEKPDGPVTNYRNEDAVVVFVNHPPHFIPGKCKNCGRVFAANKRSVGFCSDSCRKEDWRKTMHIPWAAVSTKDVWDGDPPMIVTPDQLETLEKLARWFTENQTRLEIQPLSPIEPRPKDSQDHREYNYRTQQEAIPGEVVEQTDRSEVSPHTSRPVSQSPSTLPQSEEEEPVFDFD